MTIVVGAAGVGSSAVAVAGGVDVAVGRGVDVAVGRANKTLASGRAAGCGGVSMPSSNGSAPRQVRATTIQRPRRRRRPTSRVGAGPYSVDVIGSDIPTGFLPHVYPRQT